MSSPAQILVARRVPASVLARLEGHFRVQSNQADESMSPARWIERLQGCQGVFLTGAERVDAQVVQACPQLKAVCTMTVGYNHIDLAACTARGIVVTNTPDVLTETTADFGFALMMAAARRMSEAERYLRSGQWRAWSYDLLAGSDVHGSTLGILGMGRIGQAIARRGVLGFGMSLLYHNRSRLAPEIEAGLRARWVDKATLFAEADHVVLVLPYSAEAHHCVGAAELARMKPTATLTNVARGGIVDEAALVAALRRGQLAAAGLDVFDGEPAVRPDLLTLPNVVLTPHIASATTRTRLAMADLAADNLIAALTGGRPPSALNPQVLPA